MQSVLFEKIFIIFPPRCPFGLAFDEANLRCDWPWLVPACGNVGGYPAAAGGAALPSRAEFAKSFNPLEGAVGVNTSPFPSVPSIPSFESSRTARPGPAPLRSGKAFDDVGGVAVESCDNCFSNVVTITGHGRLTSEGLEVAGGPRPRQPKAQQLSTTAGPEAGAGYSYPVPSNPLPLVVATPTTAAPPSYNPSTSGTSQFAAKVHKYDVACG